MKLAGNNKSIYSYLLIIFAVGLILRLTVLLFWAKSTTPDTLMYISQAESILSGKPFAVFPNGYPLLIALLLLVIPKVHLITALICINYLSYLGTGILIYKLTRILFDNYQIESTKHTYIMGLLAAGIFALYPTQLISANLVLTESLTTLFLTCAVYFLVINKQITSGIFMALVIMLRSVYLPLLLFFLPVISLRGRSSATNFILSASGCLLLFHTLDLIGVTSFPGNQTGNLLIAINGLSSNINHDISHFTKSEIANPISAYLTFAIKHPGEFFIQRFNSLYELWGPYSFEVNNSVLRLALGLRFILLISWLYNIYLLRNSVSNLENKQRREYIILVSIIILTISAIHFFYFSSFRFIIPLEPLMIIGLVFVIQFLFSWKHLSWSKFISSIDN